MMPFIKNLCEDTRPPYSLSMFTASVSLVLCLITVPGNVLVCLAIFKDPYKELRTSFNFFVFQLAISDLVVGVLTEPMFICFHIREAMKYPVMENIWVIHLTFFISYAASLLSLAALTLDRYLTVMSHHRRLLSTTQITLISVLIWVISFSLPCLYFVTGFYLFAFMFTNASLIIIISILTFSYIRIHQRLKDQISRWHWFKQTQIKLTAMSLEKKLTRAFYIILGIFLMCLLPSFVMIYIIIFCDECDCTLVHWMRDLQFIFLLLNCSLNQFLYAWRARNFRKAISAVFCKTVSYQVNAELAGNNNGIIAADSNSADVIELIPLDSTKLSPMPIEEMGQTNQFSFQSSEKRN